MPLTIQKLRRALEWKLAAIVQRHKGGKEQNYKIIVEGNYVARVTVPHGRGELKRGTENSIRNQFLLPRDLFEDLVECPLSARDYVRYLQESDKV